MAEEKAGWPAANAPSTRAAFEFELAVAVFGVWDQLTGQIAVRPGGAKTGWDHAARNR
jgi:hypothetical protein